MARNDGFTRWLARWRPAIALDLRGLALLRIGLGILLLVDLLLRASTLEADYTDFGFWPVAAAREPSLQNCAWSWHALDGSRAWQQCLFGAALVAASCVIVGWRTRAALLVSFGLLVSLHYRNPWLLDGGDDVLVNLMFWSLFLPLGARWSYDATLHGSDQSATTLASVASAAYVGQIWLIYLAAGFCKQWDLWSEQGAAAQALRLEAFTSDAGRWLLGFPQWVRAFSYAVIFCQRYVSWLILCPFGTTYVRCVVVAAGWLFHLSLACFLALGLFPWICLVMWIPLLPSVVWDRCDGALKQFRTWLNPSSFASPRPSPAISMPEPGRATSWWSWWPTLLVAIMAWGMLCRCAWDNFPAVFNRSIPLPRGLMQLQDQLRLRQQWGVYAPEPMRRAGWFVARGITVDGREVDLWTPEQPPTDERPDLRHFYRTQRWKRLSIYLPSDGYPTLRKTWLEWLVRRWNRDHALEANQHCVRGELRYWIEPTDGRWSNTWIQLPLYSYRAPETDPVAVPNR